MTSLNQIPLGPPLRKGEELVATFLVSPFAKGGRGDFRSLVLWRGSLPMQEQA
jgi:hypothetical protein